MLEYNKIDISEGIDVDKTNESKDRMPCHYWYFLNKNFSYGLYLCDGCYNIMQKSNNFKNIAVVHVNVVHVVEDMNKHEAKKLVVNSNLIDKKGIL